MQKWQDSIKSLHLEHIEELGGSDSEAHDAADAADNTPTQREAALPEYVPDLELHSWHCAGRRPSASAPRGAQRSAPMTSAPSAAGLRIEPVQTRLGKLERRALAFQFPLLRQRYGLLQCQGQPLPSVDFDQAAEVWLEGAQGWFLANHYRVETQDAEKRFYPQLTGRGAIILRATYIADLANQLLLQADLDSSARRKPDLQKELQKELDAIELSVTISALVEG